MKKTRDSFFVYLPLIVTILIDSLGVGIVYPIFASIFGSSIRVPYFQELSPFMLHLSYGIAIGAFPLAMLIGAPILGDLSDQIGRKKVLLISLFGEAAGMLMLGFSLYVRNLLLLVFARVFTGFLAGSIGMAQAAIIDTSSPLKKTTNLSLISLASALGFTLGPWLGGMLANSFILSKIGFTGPPLFTAAMALGNGILLAVAFKETFIAPAAAKRFNFSPLKGIIRLFEGLENQEFRYISILFFVVQLTYCMFFQTSAISLTNIFCFTTIQLGHYMSFITIIYSFTLLVIVRLAVNRFSLNKILWFSSALLIIGYTIGIIQKIPAIWLSAVFIPTGIGLAYMSLITMYSNLADEHTQGWVMGVAASMSAAGWGIGSVITGLLSSISYRLVYAAALAIAVTTFCAILGNRSKPFCNGNKIKYQKKEWQPRKDSNLN